MLIHDQRRQHIFLIAFELSTLHTFLSHADRKTQQLYRNCHLSSNRSKEVYLALEPALHGA